MSPYAVRGTARTRLKGTLLCALLLAGVVAPRVAVEVHHHAGGDHGHVHLAPDTAHDHPGSPQATTGLHHHNEAHESSSRAVYTGHHGQAHATASEQRSPSDGPFLASAEAFGHHHTYDPYQRSLKPGPIRPQARLTTTSVAPAVALDPKLESATAPCARGPPPSII